MEHLADTQRRVHVLSGDASDGVAQQFIADLASLRGRGMSPRTFTRVEAMERDAGWFLCLQWHPEDTAAVDRSQQRLYDAFVEQACALRPG